jgi:hypothetical protein
MSHLSLVSPLFQLALMVHITGAGASLRLSSWSYQTPVLGDHVRLAQPR